jgi:uncharacterized MAPEG superfamily protein
MSQSLWMVLGFAVWTLLVLIAGVGVRRWVLVLQGQAALTSFPADTPHGSVPYRRAVRAHANCLETLPVFAAIVLIGAVSGLDSPATAVLSATTLGARVAQTCVHMLFRERALTIAVRFTFFLAQVIALLAMAALLATAAMHRSVTASG